MSWNQRPHHAELLRICETPPVITELVGDLRILDRRRDLEGLTRTPGRVDKAKELARFAPDIFFAAPLDILKPARIPVGHRGENGGRIAGPAVPPKIGNHRLARGMPAEFMLVTLRLLLERLNVYPDHMARNLALTKGLYFSQTILLKLTERGMERKAAYEAVQRAAMKTWKGNESLATNLRAEPEIAENLSGEEIDRLCSLDIHFQHIDETFHKLGID